MIVPPAFLSVPRRASRSYRPPLARHRRSLAELSVFLECPQYRLAIYLTPEKTENECKTSILLHREEEETVVLSVCQLKGGEEGLCGGQRLVFVVKEKGTVYGSQRVSLPPCLSGWLAGWLAVCLPVCLFVCLSHSLSFVCVCVCGAGWLVGYLSIYLSIYRPEYDLRG